MCSVAANTTVICVYSQSVLFSWCCANMHLYVDLEVDVVRLLSQNITNTFQNVEFYIETCFTEF
jgi:hypothetical protein